MFTEEKVKVEALYEVCKDGTFSGSIYCKDTLVFLGMEKIDTEVELKNWQTYLQHALAVEQLYQYLRESIRENKKVLLEDVTWNGYRIQDLLGLSPTSEKDVKDFEDYLVSFKTFAKNNKKSLDIAASIEVGALACSQIIDIGSYIVYASKKEILGKYPFPEQCNAMPPLLALQTYFSDLIMTVCSRDSNKFDNTSFENRGIFRNPVSCFYDGSKFSGLSLKLHGFSACVRKSSSLNKYMYVGATYAMARILVNFDGWQEGDFMIQGKDFLRCTPEEKKFTRGSDMKCLIKIDALDSVGLSLRFFHDGVKTNS